MASRAICADCGEKVVATNARPIIRASGIALVCGDCGDCAVAPAVGSHPRRPSRNVSPLLSAAIAPVRKPRAVREPIPEPPFDPELEADLVEEDDYDAIYVSVEDDVSDEYPAYELDAELPPLPAPRAPIGSSSDGRDYASTSGAIEVSSGRPSRSDTTPPPAVVIGD